MSRNEAKRRFTVADHMPMRAASPIACPITAFGGSEDAEVGAGQLEAWPAETTGRFALHTLPGGHFFLQSSQAQLLALMGAESEG